MQETARRAVLTGLGVVSPLGLDLVSFWNALHAGQSGIRTLRTLDTSASPIHFGAEIEGFDARAYLEKKDRKRLPVMARTMQFAVAAADLAMKDARLGKDSIDPTRLGTVFGAGTIPTDLTDLGKAAQATVEESRPDLRKWGEAGIPQIPPMWMLAHIPNMVSCHVSMIHNTQGP